MNRTDPEDQARRAASDDRFGPRRSGHAREAHRRVDLGRWREVGKNLSGQIDEQVHKRPYVALGAAAGIGFVAGSLFGSRLGQMVLAVGIGYAARSMMEGELTPEAVRARFEKIAGGSTD
jgi:hypothetical protein